VSMASAGCLLWVEALQPFFAALAAGALGYQGWLVRRRPPAHRTRKMWGILLASVSVNLVVVVTWISLWLRYR
jgi:hypothetical protein